MLVFYILVLCYSHFIKIFSLLSDQMELFCPGKNLPGKDRGNQASQKPI
jgi:hypothetical protein